MISFLQSSNCILTKECSKLYKFEKTGLFKLLKEDSIGKRVVIIKSKNQVIEASYAGR
jgi:hypothetical protein